MHKLWCFVNELKLKNHNINNESPLKKISGWRGEWIAAKDPLEGIPNRARALHFDRDSCQRWRPEGTASGATGIVCCSSRYRR